MAQFEAQTDICAGQIDKTAIHKRDGIVTVVPSVIDLMTGAMSITIDGLKEGAHIVISVPGAEEAVLLISKRGSVRAFGFGNSDNDLIRIGDKGDIKLVG